MLNQSDSSDDLTEPNTLDDEDEWKDVEPENVVASFVSFGGITKYGDIEEFLEDAKDNHGVDLIMIKNRHGMYWNLCSQRGAKESQAH